MLLPVLLGLALVFALALAGRVGGARRAAMVAHWPALLLAGAAIVSLGRGALWPGLVLAVLAGLAWRYWPLLRSRTAAKSNDEAADEREARAVLGVRRGAGDAEIRAAYRAKMARAHPDRGGGHAEAARLTAARDRLLKEKRGP